MPTNALKTDDDKQGEEIKRTEELRIRLDPDAKTFATQLLNLRYKDASVAVRSLIGRELKAILRENGEDPKIYKDLLDRFKP